MGAVGIIGCPALSPCSDNIRVPLLVMLCKAIGGRLCRCCLQVVQIPVHLLIIGQPFPHVVQHMFRKLLGLFMSHILFKPLCVQPCLIHAYQADGGKMIVKIPQIPLGIRIQPAFHQLGNHFPLGL